MTNEELALSIRDWVEVSADIRRDIGRELECRVLEALDANATEIAALREANRKLAEDVESCCNALDYLSSQATLGPAILANLDEAGRNEIEERRRYARKALHDTHNWREAEAAMESEALTNPIASAAVRGTDGKEKA